MTKPKVGTKWVRPASRGRGFVINHSQETRRVIDTTLGGDIVFLLGRSSIEYSCTADQWDYWVHDAKQMAA